MSSYSSADIGLAFGLTLGAGLATTIGAALSFCIPPGYTDILPISLSFSAGVMIYVSFMEILQKGVDAFEIELSKIYDEEKAIYLSHIYTSISFFAGIIIGYIIDFIVHLLGYEHDIDIAKEMQKKQQNQKKNEKPSTSQMQLVSRNSTSNNAIHNKWDDDDDIENDILNESNSPNTEIDSVNNENNIVENKQETEKKALIKMSLITALAIGIHNFPEGLATFVSALADPTLGVSIATAIAIHNIPEGVCVAMPIYFATNSKFKAFFWAFLSGIFEPIGALIGYAILDSMFNDIVFGVLFGFVAGIMIYISFKELLPTARRKDKNDKYTSILLFSGFLIMDISLILFKLA